MQSGLVKEVTIDTGEFWRLLSLRVISITLTKSGRDYDRHPTSKDRGHGSDDPASKADHEESTSEATIKIFVGNQKEPIHIVETGVGPVNAIERVFRKSVIKEYPEIESVMLVDFHPRTLNGDQGTASEVEIGLTFQDSDERWKTFAVSDNLHTATLRAFEQGYAYKIEKERAQA